MATQTNNLYLLEDLDDASKTRQFAKSDLAALRTVADWIKNFIARPHKDLGRAGPVCPFVPGALERKALWRGSRADHRPGRASGCRANEGLRDASSNGTKSYCKREKSVQMQVVMA